MFHITKQSPNFLTCPIDPMVPLPEDVGIAEDREEQRPEPQSAQRRPHHLGRWVLFIILILVVVFVVPPAIAGSRAAMAGIRAKQDLEMAREHLRQLDVTAAVQDLSAAHINLQEVRDALDGTGFWRDVPGIGTQIRGLQDATTVGMQTLDGARDVVMVIESLRDGLNSGSISGADFVGQIAPTRKFSDLTTAEKRDVLATFANALPRFRIARDKVDVALELWNRIPQDGLIAPIRSTLKPLADQLPVLKRSIDEAVPLLETGMSVAGYPTPTRFLLALQNSDELRPGGGFIGNVGTMTLDAGDMKELVMGDVYAIDNPVSAIWKEVPPKQLRDHLGSTAWFLRDANWSPDFPTSAARMLDFYIREVELATGKKMATPPTVVVAIEPGFIRALFQLTGPIMVDGVQYTATNFFDSLEYEVEQGFIQRGIPLEQRKILVARVGTELLSRLFALPASRWPEVLDVLTASLTQKQVLLYSSQPSLLASFDARHWSGRTPPTRGDFVWVVDANLAALKTDGVMKKEVAYQLNATDPKQLTGTVTLTYTNTNRTIDWRYTRYQSYTRVYVPEGSELLSVGGTSVTNMANVDVVKELGKTVFGTFWKVEPGKTGTLRFTYRLPISVSERMTNGTYTLDWPKQAGADDTSFSVDASFGQSVETAMPAEEESRWGDARYMVETDSTQDRSFMVKLKQR